MVNILKKEECAKVLEVYQFRWFLLWHIHFWSKFVRCLFATVSLAAKHYEIYSNTVKNNWLSFTQADLTHHILEIYFVAVVMQIM